MRGFTCGDIQYVLPHEGTTYISQETAPAATSNKTASKSDIKRQKAQGTAGWRNEPR